MGRITSYSKQIVVFFLALSLFIRPSFASSVGGWSMGNPIAQGASTIYEGSKNVIINGSDYVKKGTAKITPTAANVAKTLGKGVAGVAVSVAVEQLLGSVDWVLDPANNRIKYYLTSDTAPPNQQIVWVASGNTNQYFSSKDSACRARVAQFSMTYAGIAPSGHCAYYDKDGKYVNSYIAVYTVANPAFDPDAQDEREEKSIPLSSVAQQVITNAESATDPQKKAAAQAVTLGAAAYIVAEAEADSVKARPIAQQFEASSTTKPADEAAAAEANTATGTQTQNPTKPETTDLALEFPAFCGWAPTVCEAAQTVISFPQTLIGWWETATTSISEAWTKVKEEYADIPKENTDTELEIPDPTSPDINTDISFGGSCPASRSVPVSFAGISTEIEFSFQWFCEIASIAKPVIISISAFAAALIVAGVRTEDD